MNSLYFVTADEHGGLRGMRIDHSTDLARLILMETYEISLKAYKNGNSIKNYLLLGNLLEHIRVHHIEEQKEDSLILSELSKDNFSLPIGPESNFWGEVHEIDPITDIPKDEKNVYHYASWY